MWVLASVPGGTELAELVLPLGQFQADETAYGMDIDSVPWGRVEPAGAGWRLTVFATQEARDAALYRITSLRDIHLDNANERLVTHAERAESRRHGQSMASLAMRLVRACGGPEGFSPDMRRWITY